MNPPPPPRIRPRAAPYLAFARAAFQRQFAYRMSNWAGLMTNTFFMFFRAAALGACFDARSSIGGLSLSAVVTYVTVSQSLVMVCPQWGRIGLAEAVRTGQVAVDLLRPVNLAGLYIARRLGMSGYFVVVRMVPILSIGALAGLLARPAPYVWLPFAVSVVVAAWIAICIAFLVETSSFWLESERGVRHIVIGAGLLPSGLVLPTDFFPAWIQTLFFASPFPYTLYVPTGIWMGRYPPESMYLLIVIQLAWGLALTVASRALLAAGTRRLQIVGG